jgi:hypothetical protein
LDYLEATARTSAGVLYCVAEEETVAVSFEMTRVWQGEKEQITADPYGMTNKIQATTKLKLKIWLKEIWR